MSRIPLLTLLALGLFAGRGQAETQTLASVDYFLPVTYDMVITRAVPVESDDANKQRSKLDYELFNSRDLLKIILAANDITSTSHWSLVARGNTAAFEDPRTTDTLSSLQIVARNSKTGEIKTAPESVALSFTQVYATCAYSRTERQTDPAEETVDPSIVSSGSSLSRLAEFTQKIPALADRNEPGGTLVATGLITYGNTYGKLTVAGQTTDGPVLRPTGATFRASGPYGEDGMVELRIILGEPVYRAPAVD